jgi:hypothetical protein
MATIRGALRFSKDISIIMLLGIVYVLGLSVSTLIGATKSRLPRLHAAGGKVRSRLRRPV